MILVRLVLILILACMVRIAMDIHAMRVTVTESAYLNYRKYHPRVSE